MKISRAFVQRYLISYSCSWTGFPGRLPRTAAVSIGRGGPFPAHQPPGCKLTFEEAVDDRVEVYLRGRIRHV